MRYRVILLLSTFFLFAHSAFSQYYDTGQDPASLKWKQIKTSHFTVIYPEKYGLGGIVYAKSLDAAYSKLVSLFPEKKFNIPVIIHNYTIQSNGYVAWAPHRMELYPTPEQNTIPLSAEYQLAVHELTHVFQLESLNSGFSKGMSLFFGEQFTGLISSLLPLWFLEGDAVFAESALTGSGRGRSPSFQKELKAIIVDKPALYKYDKILNGSYRDYIPDYYRYGYQMVTWAQAKHGLGVWNKALDYTAKQPFTLNPVNISLRRNANLTKKRLYEETFDSLKTIWSKDVSQSSPVIYEPLNQSKKDRYINYESPVFAGQGNIIAVKSSLSEPSSIVLINPFKKTEKKLLTPGQMYPNQISYGNGNLVWVENQPDPRWENREYSIIKLMNISTGVTFKLSRKSRYVSVAVSHDGRRICAIENTIDNINKLVIIDAGTGTVIQSVRTPGNVYLQHPQWTEEGEKITAIFLAEAGEGIITFTIANQKWETLIGPGRNDLQSAVLRNDSLFFISSLSGTDNIYLRTSDGKITPLTRSEFGTTDLCLDGKKIFFSDYSSTGNNICSTTISKTPRAVNNHVSSKSFLINRFNIKPQSPDNNSDIVYKPEPYRKWLHLFNFHSWLPFYADLEQIKSDPTSVRPGITLMSQNQLSTLITSVGYEYSADKKHLFHSRVTWKGWYPVFESQYDYGYNPLIDKMGQNVTDPYNTKPGSSFLNTVSVPLTFSSGRFSQYFRPSFSSDYRNKYVYIKNDSSYDYGQNILSARLYFSNYDRSAFRDIYPKWAQIIDLNYTFAPFDKALYGSETSLMTVFYFPGIFPNNGIKIRLEKEKQIPVKYLFSNLVSFPRGYKNMYSRELGLISADYFLPVAYPDLNIWSLLYLKRIRTSLFYDYGSGRGNYYYGNSANGLILNSYHNYLESFRSFGFELMTDFHVLRIPFMISGGVQTAWKNINDSPTFEILFNINLFGMSVGRRQL
jgi:hypothetical protein